MSNSKITKPKTVQEVSHENEEEGNDEAVKRAVNASLVALVILLLIVGIGFGIYTYANRPEKVVDEVKQTQKVETRAEASALPTVVFTDITDTCGINFIHTNGNRGTKLLPQTMGGGVAFLDYDNDGDQDLFFVNSTYWAGEQPEDQPVPTMKLYSNDGGGKFSDVTQACGLDASFYGMGVAVGDFDNDGWNDLFVSAVGKNHLFRNQKGKFSDVTNTAGVGGREQDWGSSCGFFDYNNDGKLDLFVCNYIDWTAEKEIELDARLTAKIKAYVKPQVMDGAFPYLYRNDGQGKFTDVSAKSKIQLIDRQNKKPLNKSLGLCFVDINHDGWQDVFVANDTVRNLLFVNGQDGTFTEQGEMANIAYDKEGNARGAMGIDSACFRSDDSLGFIIGNFATEPASLYVKQAKDPIFTDESLGTGLGPETRIELTFGMCFLDYDLDGRLDILTANGHLEEEIHMKLKSQTYQQPPHLFWNAGEDQRSEFVSVDAAHCGADLGKPMVGRGLTYADIDSDGDLDVVITAVNAKPRILRNDQQTGHHWIEIKLIGKDHNRDALGAKIEIQTPTKKYERLVTATRSYLSQTQIPVLFGLGNENQIEQIVVTWPDDSKQVLKNPKINQRVNIQKN
ncbi:MAG: CRTAC1 family protein [Planctomycetota bacterium]|nr:CRTAC1 family protein [Planctomycetota bacterium]